jgi:hypothetical protein
MTVPADVADADGRTGLLTHERRVGPVHANSLAYAECASLLPCVSGLAWLLTTEWRAGHA